MTDQHKAAIASGRAEGAVVKRYLESLQRQRRPGRRVTKDQLAQRLEKTREQIDTEENPLVQLELTQAALVLEKRLNEADEAVDDGDAEDAFIRIAKSYAQRKQISYTAFRQMGVPAPVLKKAGIPQERQRRS